jgi:hypothetical protein
LNRLINEAAALRKLERLEQAAEQGSTTAGDMVTGINKVEGQTRGISAIAPESGELVDRMERTIGRFSV